MPPQRHATIASITLGHAQEVLVVATETALELNAPASIAIVDSVGLLKAMIRMDNAPLIGIDLARRKAYTCVAMGGRSTADMAKAIADDPVMLAVTTSLPDLAVLGGGSAILVDGTVVGAIGVSSPTGRQDLLISETAISRVTRTPHH